MVSRSSIPAYELISNRTSCNCDVWFDQSKKKLSSLEDLWAVHEILSAEDQSMLSTNPEMISGKKRKRTLNDDFSIVPFKNVKLADREAASKNGALKASLAPSKPPIESNSTYDDFDDPEYSDEENIRGLLNATQYADKVKVRLKCA